MPKGNHAGGIFLGEWGQMLSGNIGEQIIEQCRRGATVRGQKGRRDAKTEKEQRRIVSDYLNGGNRTAILQQYRITDD